MSDMIARFQAMLDSGQDSPMLRLALASALLGAGQDTRAIAHLEHAVALDPNYSAAWKLLAKSLLTAGEPSRALAACERGIEVARTRGDLQAAREMEVFAKRARRQQDDSGSEG